MVCEYVNMRIWVGLCLEDYDYCSILFLSHSITTGALQSPGLLLSLLLYAAVVIFYI